MRGWRPALHGGKPLAGAPKSRGADARIGGTRQGANDVALDFDQATGNLFAVVAWLDDWTVNISTDGGITWSETFDFGDTGLVDAAVVDQYLYVGYSPADEPASVRTRRFFVTDGSPDGDYFYEEVADVSPNTILDIVAGANADYTNDRIYCAFIESNNAVRFYWDEASSGTTWAAHSPPWVNAASSLDYHFGWGTMGSDPVGLWLSYLGTDGRIRVLGATFSGGWVIDTMPPDLPADARVRMSAHGNNVFVAYRDQGTNAYAAKYYVSYDNGQNWNEGTAYNPPAGEPSINGIDITARGGWGSGLIFNVEDTFDSVYVATREDYHQGGWNPPIDFNQFDAYSGAPSFIQYLRPLGAFGMVYLAGSSAADSTPYFDVIALMPFDDGFESGDTSAWSNEFP